MTFKITLYGMKGYDPTGFGHPIYGHIVLRDDIPKLTTARILACRYSKKYGKSGYEGPKIDVWKNGKIIECIYPTTVKGDYVSERTGEDKNRPKDRSPIVHIYYHVNAKTGEIRLKETYQKKW